MNFKLMITEDGKHPASKWAELAIDEIITIVENAPDALVREAREFKNKLSGILTDHFQAMMDHEQEEIKCGNHDLDCHYDTEDYSDQVVSEICALAEGNSFAEHFAKPETIAHLTAVCNRFFKSAKLVERQHFHTDKARRAGGKKK